MYHHSGDLLGDTGISELAASRRAITECREIDDICKVLSLGWNHSLLPRIDGCLLARCYNHSTGRLLIAYMALNTWYFLLSLRFRVYFYFIY